jgi:hypothetical protein
LKLLEISDAHLLRYDVLASIQELSVNEDLREVQQLKLILQNVQDSYGEVSTPFLDEEPWSIGIKNSGEL